MNSDKGVVPGLSVSDLEDITNQIFERKDMNHPHSSDKKSSFIDILENAEPDISASSIFIKKISS